MSLILDFLALISVLSGVFVITARSPVVAVLYLISVFVLSACYLIALGIGFIGLAYLVVYVGAVAVLFLFVIMILNIRLSEIVTFGQEYTKGLPLGFLIGSLFLLELISVMPYLKSNNFLIGILTKINELFLGVSLNNISPSDVHLIYSPVADSTFISLSQIQVLGISLYTNGAIWLLLISIILLLAIIGPIALCMRIKTS